MSIGRSNNPIFNSFRTNTQNNIQRSTQRLSSGRRINSAADDAAGLGIAQRMSSQIRGLNQGTRNATDMDSLMRTADGGLSGVSESLQRVRELSLQASNSILTPNQRQMIQNEIDQHLSNINDLTQNTQFNSQPLLDGSFQDGHMAAAPDGSGPSVNIDASHAAALGLENFDSTGTSVDLNAIDRALDNVAGNRASLGATMNRTEHIIYANNVSSENLSAARSRIEDADMAFEFMRMNQERVIEQYQMFMFRSAMDRERSRLGFVGVPW